MSPENQFGVERSARSLRSRLTVALHAAVVGTSQLWNAKFFSIKS